MMKNKKTVYYLSLIPIVFILGLFVWFFMIIFEGESPRLTIEPLPEFISKKQEFVVKAVDPERGIRAIRVSYTHGGKEETVLDETFPFHGFFNARGTHDYETEFTIDPQTLRLAQGSMDIRIQAWDYSRKNGGDGNTTVLTHSLVVDTMPPTMRPLSQIHYVNQGGAGLVVYRASLDTIESGVYVNEIFFRGYPASDDPKNENYTAYFAVPYNITDNPSISLWAKDKAENTINTAFSCHVKRKQFENDNMNITDSFLKNVLPYFFDEIDSAASDIDNYIRINRETRIKDNALINDLMKDVTHIKLWEGTWVRLK
ncbi:MAG: hypothetical protein JW944_00565, partial [Deltaproteobacteria bacterium]|nr:hypothetical protein [Deltaproteobacteria bacterium]